MTTLLLDHKAFKDTTDIFVERYKDMKIDVVVGKPHDILLLLFLLLVQAKFLAESQLGILDKLAIHLLLFGFQLYRHSNMTLGT